MAALAVSTGALMALLLALALLLQPTAATPSPSSLANPAEQAQRAESQVPLFPAAPATPAPAHTRGHEHHAIKNVAQQAEKLHHRSQAQAQTKGQAKGQAQFVPNTCPGIPYDFSTSNYCQAELLDLNSWTFPANPPGVPSLTLKSLQLVTRHGDRVPVNILPATDVAYNLCGATQSTGYYANPPPAAPSHAGLGEGVHGGHRRGGAQAQDAPAQEGRRLEQIPLLYAQGETNPFASQLWQGTCATGQLTTVGVQQHVTAGQGLKSIYVDKLGFLPSSYDRSNNSFYLRSTDVWRTKQSAEALLSGLWPTSNLAGKDADVIPFRSFPLEIETMFANGAKCPALAKVQAAQMASPEWVAHLDYPDVWDVLDRTMGIKGMPAWHAAYDHVFDNLHTRQCHNLPLPCNPSNSSDCVPSSLADFVYAQGSWEYAFGNNASPLADQVAWMGISGFMAVLRDNILAQVTGDAGRSTIGAPAFAYYSGHDSTLGAVLGALNVTGMAWPPYASQLLFEVWQNPSVSPSPDAFYVRALYNAQVLKLFGAGCCDELCPATAFIKFLDSVVPTNVPDMCQNGAKPQFKNSL